MSVIAKQTIKTVFNGEQFVSTYSISSRTGWQGALIHCVEVSHTDKHGSRIFDGAVSSHESPDAAWNAYQSAIKNQPWGSL